MENSFLFRHKLKILWFSFLLFCLFFAFSVFKNLQYGVLWNDEAETAMYARSIITYGYPKVHYGKNVLNVAETKDLSVGVKEKNDAWIYISSWGAYYFAVPFVLLADRFSDIYVKTFILRAPFAFLGLLGILIFAFAGSLVFRNKVQKLLFLNLFIFLEILSIPLILHIREMRHYSITIFLISILFFLNVRSLVGGIKKKVLYQFFSFLLLILLMNIYFPAFLSSFCFLVLLFILSLKFEKERKEVIVDNFYLFLVFFFLIPYLWFFEFFQVSSAISQNFSYDLNRFFSNLYMATLFFLKSEYFLLSFLSILLLFVFLVKKKTSFSDNLNKSIIFISLYILISLLIVSRIPYFFERYYIFLQPFFIIILIFSTFSIFDSLQKTGSSFSTKMAFFYVLFSAIIFNSVFKLDLVKGHIYELFHPFRGTMDYLVSYILENYTDPSRLVIATNYEEYVLMYYLDAKVIIGYVGNNLENDLKEVPDIVVIRKNRPNFAKELNSFLDKYDYKRVVLDVYDYQVNNIPENTLPLKHLFRPLIPKDDSERLTIFVRRL